MQLATVAKKITALFVVFTFALSPSQYSFAANDAITVQDGQNVPVTQVNLEEDPNTVTLPPHLQQHMNQSVSGTHYYSESTSPLSSVGPTLSSPTTALSPEIQNLQDQLDANQAEQAAVREELADLDQQMAANIDQRNNLQNSSNQGHSAGSSGSGSGRTAEEIQNEIDFINNELIPGLEASLDDQENLDNLRQQRDEAANELRQAEWDLEDAKTAATAGTDPFTYDPANADPAAEAKIKDAQDKVNEKQSALDDIDKDIQEAEIDNEVRKEDIIRELERLYDNIRNLEQEKTNAGNDSGSDLGGDGNADMGANEAELAQLDEEQANIANQQNAANDRLNDLQSQASNIESQIQSLQATDSASSDTTGTETGSENNDSQYQIIIPPEIQTIINDFSHVFLADLEQAVIQWMETTQFFVRTDYEYDAETGEVINSTDIYEQWEQNVRTESVRSHTSTLIEFFSYAASDLNPKYVEQAIAQSAGDYGYQDTNDLRAEIVQMVLYNYLSKRKEFALNDQGHFDLGKFYADIRCCSTTILDGVRQNQRNWADIHKAELLIASGKTAGANFSGMDLRKMSFSGINLEGANFTGANLEGASFVGANLVNANFTGANLTNSNFTSSNVTGATFAGVNITNAKFENMTGLETDAGKNIPSCLIGYSFAGSCITNDPLTDYWLGSMNTYDAWRYSTGKDVIVAVIDTGVNDWHEDLQGKIVPGWNFYEGNSNTLDDASGHGTHVAGIIAASGNNNVGIIGVAPDAKIMPIRVTSGLSMGKSEMVHSLEMLSHAIRFAVNNGAHVINMSLAYNVLNGMLKGGVDYQDENGVYVNQPYWERTWQAVYALRDAVAYAEMRNVAVIVAAGNDDESLQHHTMQYLFPAATNNLFTVGAVDANNQRATFSNYNSDSYNYDSGSSEATGWVNIAAPGADILSLSGFGTYVKNSGTSMASPAIAGVVALLKGMDLNRSLNSIADRIKQTATQFSEFLFDAAGNGFSVETLGFGLVNAGAALALDWFEKNKTISVNATKVTDTAEQNQVKTALSVDSIMHPVIYKTISDDGLTTTYYGTNETLLGSKKQNSENPDISIWHDKNGNEIKTILPFEPRNNVNSDITLDDGRHMNFNETTKTAEITDPAGVTSHLYERVELVTTEGEDCSAEGECMHWSSDPSIELNQAELIGSFVRHQRSENGTISISRVSVYVLPTEDIDYLVEATLAFGKTPKHQIKHEARYRCDEEDNCPMAMDQDTIKYYDDDNKFLGRVIVLLGGENEKTWYDENLQPIDLNVTAFERTRAEILAQVNAAIDDNDALRNDQLARLEEHLAQVPQLVEDFEIEMSALVSALQSLRDELQAVIDPALFDDSSIESAQQMASQIQDFLDSSLDNQKEAYISFSFINSLQVMNFHNEIGARASFANQLEAFRKSAEAAESMDGLNALPEFPELQIAAIDPAMPPADPRDSINGLMTSGQETLAAIPPAKQTIEQIAAAVVENDFQGIQVTTDLSGGHTQSGTYYAFVIRTKDESSHSSDMNYYYDKQGAPVYSAFNSEEVISSLTDLYPSASIYQNYDGTFTAEDYSSYYRYSFDHDGNQTNSEYMYEYDTAHHYDYSSVDVYSPYFDVQRNEATVSFWVNSASDPSDLMLILRDSSGNEQSRTPVYCSASSCSAHVTNLSEGLTYYGYLESTNPNVSLSGETSSINFTTLTDNMYNGYSSMEEFARERFPGKETHIEYTSGTSPNGTYYNTLIFNLTDQTVLALTDSFYEGEETSIDSFVEHKVRYNNPMISLFYRNNNGGYTSEYTYHYGYYYEVHFSDYDQFGNQINSGSTQSYDYSYHNYTYYDTTNYNYYDTTYQSTNYVEIGWVDIVVSDSSPSIATVNFQTYNSTSPSLSVRVTDEAGNWISETSVSNYCYSYSYCSQEIDISSLEKGKTYNVQIASNEHYSYVDVSGTTSANFTAPETQQPQTQVEGSELEQAVVALEINQEIHPVFYKTTTIHYECTDSPCENNATDNYYGADGTFLGSRNYDSTLSVDAGLASSQWFDETGKEIHLAPKMTKDIDYLAEATLAFGKAPEHQIKHELRSVCDDEGNCNDVIEQDTVEYYDADEKLLGRVIVLLGAENEKSWYDANWQPIDLDVAAFEKARTEISNLLSAAMAENASELEALRFNLKSILDSMVIENSINAFETDMAAARENMGRILNEMQSAADSYAPHLTDSLIQKIAEIQAYLNDSLDNDSEGWKGFLSFSKTYFLSSEIGQRDTYAQTLSELLTSLMNAQSLADLHAAFPENKIPEFFLAQIMISPPINPISILSQMIEDGEILLADLASRVSEAIVAYIHQFQDLVGEGFSVTHERQEDGSVLITVADAKNWAASLNTPRSGLKELTFSLALDGKLKPESLHATYYGEDRDIKVDDSKLLFAAMGTCPQDQNCNMRVMPEVEALAKLTAISVTAVDEEGAIYFTKKDGVDYKAYRDEAGRVIVELDLVRLDVSAEENLTIAAVFGRQASYKKITTPEMTCNAIDAGCSWSKTEYFDANNNLIGSRTDRDLPSDPTVFHNADGRRIEFQTAITLSGIANHVFGEMPAYQLLRKMPDCAGEMCPAVMPTHTYHFFNQNFEVIGSYTEEFGTWVDAKGNQLAHQLPLDDSDKGAETILGHLPSWKMVNDNKTTYFDADGKLIGTKTILKPDENTTVTTWRGAEGNTKQITTTTNDLNGNTKTTTQDSAGKLIRAEETFADGRRITTDYSYANHQARDWNKSELKEFDLQGNLVWSTITQINKWEYAGVFYSENIIQTFDANGILRETYADHWTQYNTSVSPRLDWVSRRTYNEQSKETYHQFESFAPTRYKQTNSYTYDTDGTTIIKQDSVYEEMNAAGVTVKTYQTVIENGITTTVVRDALNRILRNETAIDGKTTQRMEWDYSGGFLIEVRDFRVNLAGELALYSTSKYTHYENGANKTNTQTWEPGFNLTDLRFKEITYATDGVTVIKQETITSSKDGKTTTTIIENGTTTTQIKDELGRLIKNNVALPDGSRQTLDYFYEDNSNQYYVTTLEVISQDVSGAITQKTSIFYRRDASERDITITVTDYVVAGQTYYRLDTTITDRSAGYQITEAYASLSLDPNFSSVNRDTSIDEIMTLSDLKTIAEYKNPTEIQYFYKDSTGNWPAGANLIERENDFYMAVDGTYIKVILRSPDVHVGDKTYLLAFRATQYGFNDEGKFGLLPMGFYVQGDSSVVFVEFPKERRLVIDNVLYEMSVDTNGVISLKQLIQPFEIALPASTVSGENNLKVRVDAAGNAFVTWYGTEYIGKFDPDTKQIAISFPERFPCDDCIILHDETQPLMTTNSDVSTVEKSVEDMMIERWYPYYEGKKAWTLQLSDNLNSVVFFQRTESNGLYYHHSSSTTHYNSMGLIDSESWSSSYYKNGYSSGKTSYAYILVNGQQKLASVISHTSNNDYPYYKYPIKIQPYEDLRPIEKPAITNEEINRIYKPDVEYYKPIWRPYYPASKSTTKTFYAYDAEGNYSQIISISSSTVNGETTYSGNYTNYRGDIMESAFASNLPAEVFNNVNEPGTHHLIEEHALIKTEHHYQNAARNWNELKFTMTYARGENGLTPRFVQMADYKIGYIVVGQPDVLPGTEQNSDDIMIRLGQAVNGYSVSFGEAYDYDEMIQYQPQSESADIVAPQPFTPRYLGFGLIFSKWGKKEDGSYGQTIVVVDYPAAKTVELDGQTFSIEIDSEGNVKLISVNEQLEAARAQLLATIDDMIAAVGDMSEEAIARRLAEAHARFESDTIDFHQRLGQAHAMLDEQISYLNTLMSSAYLSEATRSAIADLLTRVENYAQNESGEGLQTQTSEYLDWIRSSTIGMTEMWNGMNQDYLRSLQDFRGEVLSAVDLQAITDLNERIPSMPAMDAMAPSFDPTEMLSQLTSEALSFMEEVRKDILLHLHQEQEENEQGLASHRERLNNLQNELQRFDHEANQLATNLKDLIAEIRDLINKTPRTLVVSLDDEKLAEMQAFLDDEFENQKKDYKTILSSWVNAQVTVFEHHAQSLTDFQDNIMSADTIGRLQELEAQFPRRPVMGEPLMPDSRRTLNQFIAEANQIIERLRPVMTEAMEYLVEAELAFGKKPVHQAIIQDSCNDNDEFCTHVAREKIIEYYDEDKNPLGRVVVHPADQSTAWFDASGEPILSTERQDITEEEKSQVQTIFGKDSAYKVLVNPGQTCDGINMGCVWSKTEYFAANNNLIGSRTDRDLPSDPTVFNNANGRRIEFQTPITLSGIANHVFGETPAYQLLRKTPDCSGDQACPDVEPIHTYHFFNKNFEAMGSYTEELGAWVDAKGNLLAQLLPLDDSDKDAGTILGGNPIYKIVETPDSFCEATNCPVGGNTTFYFNDSGIFLGSKVVSIYRDDNIEAITNTPEGNSIITPMPPEPTFITPRIEIKWYDADGKEIILDKSPSDLELYAKQVAEYLGLEEKDIVSITTEDNFRAVFCLGTGCMTWSKYVDVIAMVNGEEKHFAGVMSGGSFGSDHHYVVTAPLNLVAADGSSEETTDPPVIVDPLSPSQKHSVYARHIFLIETHPYISGRMLDDIHEVIGFSGTFTKIEAEELEVCLGDDCAAWKLRVRLELKQGENLIRIFFGTITRLSEENIIDLREIKLLPENATALSEVESDLARRVLQLDHLEIMYKTTERTASDIATEKFHNQEGTVIGFKVLQGNHAHFYNATENGDMGALKQSLELVSDPAELKLVQALLARKSADHSGTLERIYRITQGGGATYIAVYEGDKVSENIRNKMRLVFLS